MYDDLQVAENIAEMVANESASSIQHSLHCSSFNVRVVMPRELVRSVDRRGFLRLGLCAGILGAAGCGSAEEGADAPKVEAGNRSRLDSIKTKINEAPPKKK